MREVEIRFYAELNDFLPPKLRAVAFRHSFWGERSVKDLIEGLGVPHTEVELVLVNGEAVGFGHRLRGGERVAVYPVFEQIDLGEQRILRREPLRNLRFCADAHLGRLARGLRLLGFDTWYEPDADDVKLRLLAVEERRVLLTRDRALLMHGQIERGYWVRATDPRKQLFEIVERFHLEQDSKPFTRCLRCNGVLEEADISSVRGRVPARVLASHECFMLCPQCGRVYWRGSHYDAMAGLLRDLGIPWSAKEEQA